MAVKLLIVDDEPKIRWMLTACLESPDLEIAAASSGSEALTIISQAHPQLMILDVKMPGMDGLEVLRQVRVTTPQIGVLFLTGYDDDAIEQQASQLGALGVIHKPLVFSEIRQTIQQAIANLPPV